MAEIVKSSYVLDPEDQMRLIRRDEEGTEIDREYWDRVNQERICLEFYILCFIYNFVFIFCCENMKNKFPHSGRKCFECSQNV